MMYLYLQSWPTAQCPSDSHGKVRARKTFAPPIESPECLQTYNLS